MTAKNVAIVLLAALVAAYPAQKLVAEAWNAPTVLVWGAWLALTLGIVLLVRTAIVRRQGRTD